jgi:hypothetical protein
LAQEPPHTLPSGDDNSQPNLETAQPTNTEASSRLKR